MLRPSAWRFSQRVRTPRLDGPYPAHGRDSRARAGKRQGIVDPPSPSSFTILLRQGFGAFRLRSIQASEDKRPRRTRPRRSGMRRPRPGPRSARTWGCRGLRGRGAAETPQPRRVHWATKRGCSASPRKPRHPGSSSSHPRILSGRGILYLQSRPYVL